MHIRYQTLPPVCDVATQKSETFMQKMIHHDWSGCDDSDDSDDKIITFLIEGVICKNSASSCLRRLRRNIGKLYCKILQVDQILTRKSVNLRRLRRLRRFFINLPCARAHTGFYIIVFIVANVAK